MTTGRQRVQVFGDCIDFVGGAEQKGSVNAKDGGVVGSGKRIKDSVNTLRNMTTRKNN